MRIIYIAHPISGDIQGNLNKVLDIVRELNLTEDEIVPFAPYWIDCHALDDNDPVQRQRGIDNDIALFKKGFIDEVWLYGDKISNGMRNEIELAASLGIKIRAMSTATVKEYNWIINNN